MTKYIRLFFMIGVVFVFSLDGPTFEADLALVLFDSKVFCSPHARTAHRT